MMLGKQEIILDGEAQRAIVMRAIEELRLDKPIVVTIEPYKKKRSLSQNALLWKRHTEITNAISEYTGYSAEDVHEILKQKFLQPTILEINGQIVKRYSSKNLTTAEMTKFMDQIEAFAQTELGIILTNPEDRMAR